MDFLPSFIEEYEQEYKRYWSKTSDGSMILDLMNDVKAMYPWYQSELQKKIRIAQCRRIIGSESDLLQ